MPLKKASVLIVDDDIRILRMMRSILELENYRVITVSNGEAALNIFNEEVPDLVLLDIMMPGMDGYIVCHSIREFSQVPIIIVTAKSGDQDKIAMLDDGADDYVTKPFSSKELTARVKAVLRRITLQGHVQLFLSNELVIDFARHSVKLREQQIKLTPTEYGLLCYLAVNAGRVVTSDQILEKVWGEEYTAENHLLQVNIARLRRKLDDCDKNCPYIVTRPGIGYMMQKS